MQDENERIYLELKLQKSLETDENGNPIIVAEASNENLDLQEQVVLQRALMDSKEYFLSNGVIAYDHKHLRPDPEDPSWTPEKYIIGQPISVERRGKTTIVKARLFKSNEIVKELVSKLQDGATYIKTSVGGLRPKVIKEWDGKLKKMVEKVTSVLWSELSITPRPVNSTLGPVVLSSSAFVKSIQVGHSTDSATATGGASLVKQDLDGAGDSKKRAIKAVIVALTTGECAGLDSARSIIRENGVIDDKVADEIIEAVVNGKNQVKGVFKMDGTLEKAFDDSLADLEKALKGDAPAKPDKAKVPAAPDDDELYQDDDEGEGDDNHAEPDADNAGGPSDGDADNEGEDDDDNGEGVKPPMKKSVDADDDEVQYLDVTPVLESLSKSLALVVEENKALRAQNSEVMNLVKSMAANQIATAQLIKSMGDQPAMRKSVMTRQDRRFVGQGDVQEVEQLPREVALAKSMAAVTQGKITLRDASIIEDRLNKGILLDANTVTLLKSIQ
jgi:hypothetical protein